MKSIEEISFVYSTEYSSVHELASRSGHVFVEECDGLSLRVHDIIVRCVVLKPSGVLMALSCYRVRKARWYYRNE